MHEYSLVATLLDRVDEEARHRGARAVHRVWLEVGELAGVEVELLRLAYDAFRERTLCAAAPLEIEPVAAAWSCPRCGGEMRGGSARRCPECGVPARLVRGDELNLRRIEMEVA